MKARPALALEAAAALDPVLVTPGPYETRREVLEAALALPVEPEAIPARIDVLRSRGRQLSQRGAHGKAEEAYKEAIELARKIGDREREGVMLAFLGFAYRGDPGARQRGMQVLRSALCA